MVDYVKVATAGTTNLALASAWTPAGGPPVSVTADTATWNATSLGGSLSGNFTTRKVTINGATANIVHSGTITLGADGFEFAAANNRQWSQSGAIAVGAANQTWRLNNAGLGMQVSAAAGLTGSAVVLITNNSTDQSYGNAYIVFTGACTGFTGTIELSDNVVLYTNNATGALTACNILVSGAARLAPNVSGTVLGSNAKTLTVNSNMFLGEAAKSLTIAYAVALGSVTRTLTVYGNTNMTGTVTGSAGVTATIQNSTGRVGGAGSQYLYLTGSSSGLTGACIVSGGRFVVGPSTTAARYAPTSINVASDASFEYFPMSSTDFTFPCAPTGTGFIVILGNHTAGGGITFSAGQLASFGGIVRSSLGPDSGFQASRIRLNELPGGLDWLANPNANSAMTGEFTYIGGAATYATNLTLDTYSNTSTAGLTGGTYSLIVPNTSGALAITGTVQRLNTAGTASARMSLTLGGSNTGDNTLSGDISEVGTNGAILGLTKVDAGRWVLSGANSSHTGIHTITAGTLSAQSAKALGSATSAGGVTISGTGALELSGGITLDKSSTAFTIHQTSPIKSIGDNTVRTAGVTLGGTTTFEVTTGNRLAISNTGAITDGASTFGITKTGDGELALAAFTNTYDGAVAVSAGTLAIGSQGALGNGNVTLTGTLKYTGTGETYSRSTFLSGAAPSLEAAGSGAITVTNLSQDSTTKTLTLKGANTGANTVTVALSDSSNPLSLAKSGAGKWVTTGALSYSGSTTVSDGTLRVQTANSNTTSGAVTIGANGAVELVTDTLASTGGGAVLGSSHVAVNGGIIKTRGGTTQKGQMRYGGNLTFGADSSLYIGAAA